MCWRRLRGPRRQGQVPPGRGGPHLLQPGRDSQRRSTRTGRSLRMSRLAYAPLRPRRPWSPPPPGRRPPQIAAPAPAAGARPPTSPAATPRGPSAAVPRPACRIAPSSALSLPGPVPLAESFAPSRRAARGWPRPHGPARGLTVPRSPRAAARQKGSSQAVTTCGGAGFLRTGRV